MEYIVEDKHVGMRLDQYINIVDIDLTRAFAQKLIEKGDILVNNKISKSSYKLKINDVVYIKEIEPEESSLKAEDIKLKVIYEDDDILVINKQKGMVVHPGNGNHNGTVVNALMFSHGDSLSHINGVIRPGIVHRIDKDTSGVIIIAKNDKAHKRLSEAFKVHDIKRKYIALVDGILEKSNLKINLPIGRDDKNRQKMAVTTKNSKEAVTNIKVIERFVNSGYTLIEATLETGRTHQIRVHMAYIGHPLVGDEVYGKKKNEFDISGQMLHAKLLGIKHPTTGEYMEFETSIPKEFEEILIKLKKKEGK